MEIILNLIALILIGACAYQGYILGFARTLYSLTLTIIAVGGLWFFFIGGVEALIPDLPSFSYAWINSFIGIAIFFIVLAIIVFLTVTLAPIHLITKLPVIRFLTSIVGAALGLFQGALLLTIIVAAALYFGLHQSWEAFAQWRFAIYILDFMR